MNGKWHSRVKTLVGLPATLIGAVSSTASAAVATSQNADQFSPPELNTVNNPVTLPNTLNSAAQDKYAAHRSHSSHGSHRSHRSSSGGGYTPSPTPRTSPVPSPSRSSPPATPPSSPSSTQSVPRPSASDLSTMTIRVQAALMRLGYYNGDIDGILGPQTRESLMAYQKSQGLAETGRMDIETLTRLGISIP